jgi:hypothetical protein
VLIDERREDYGYAYRQGDRQDGEERLSPSPNHMPQGYGQGKWV